MHLAALFVRHGFWLLGFLATTFSYGLVPSDDSNALRRYARTVAARADATLVATAHVYLSAMPLLRGDRSHRDLEVLADHVHRVRDEADAFARVLPPDAVRESAEEVNTALDGLVEVAERMLEAGNRVAMRATGADGPVLRRDTVEAVLSYGISVRRYKAARAEVAAELVSFGVAIPDLSGLRPTTPALPQRREA